MFVLPCFFLLPACVATDAWGHVKDSVEVKGQVTIEDKPGYWPDGVGIGFVGPNGVLLANVKMLNFFGAFKGRETPLPDNMSEVVIVSSKNPVQ